MPDTGSSSSSSKSREHNQGNQNRSYSADQKTAVDRVRRCKVTDFYAILDIEKTVSEGEIKKAYRRLALVMHPDKNGAPGADEAFKLVSRAFQVLSDPQKRQDYDKFGGDPDARGGGEGRGGGASPFGGGFPMHSGFAGEEISPEDLFNMFFGGVSPFGGGFQGGGGPFGEFVRFGGPGIRVQTFGGGTPRRRRPPPESSAGGAAHQHPQQPEAEASFRSTVIQLLPLIFLFFIPLLSSLFSDLGTGYSSTAKRPEYRFEEIHPFTKMRTTPRHHIPYWVSPRELKEFSMTDKKLREMDKRVETIFVSNLQKDCKTEMIQQQREIEDASGWFWEDVDASKKAREKVLISCMRLRELGEGRLMG